MSRPASRMELIRADPLLVVTAVASLGAGAVHGAVAPEHTNWWPSVVFFVILAVFQVGWGLFVLMRPPVPGTLLMGAGVSVVTLATWAVSRTSGIPVGPHQGSAEPSARADVIASLLGVLVVVGAFALFRGWRPHALRRVRPALSAAAGGVAVTALSLVALTGVPGHAHSPDHDHGPEANLRPAAAFAEFSPEAAATTLCRGAVQATSDATFAEAAAAANGDAAAITEAEAAATEQLKRALTACGGAPVPAPVQPEESAEATAHADDGHSH